MEISSILCARARLDHSLWQFPQQGASVRGSEARGSRQDGRQAGGPVYRLHNPRLYPAVSAFLQAPRCSSPADRLPEATAALLHGQLACTALQCAAIVERSCCRYVRRPSTHGLGVQSIAFHGLRFDRPSMRSHVQPCCCANLAICPTRNHHSKCIVNQTCRSRANSTLGQSFVDKAWRLPCGRGAC